MLVGPHGEDARALLLTCLEVTPCPGGPEAQKGVLTLSVTSELNFTRPRDSIPFKKRTHQLHQ